MIRAAQVRDARKRYKEMAPVLDEQSRRRFAALEAQALGHGGVSLMARITGLARRTIYRGISDIQNNCSAEPGRIRKSGAGRKKKASQDPTPFEASRSPSGEKAVLVTAAVCPSSVRSSLPLRTSHSAPCAAARESSS
jgi:hypothetical protein